MNQQHLFFKVLTFLLLLQFLNVGNIFSQKKLKTESGQEIIILEDGSWRYAEKTNGSHNPGISADSLQSSEALDLASDLNQRHDKLYNEVIRIENKLLYNEAETASQLTVLQGNLALLKEEIELYDKGEMEDLKIEKVELEDELLAMESREKLLNMRYEIINNMIIECISLKDDKNNLDLDDVRSLQIRSNAVDFNATSPVAKPEEEDPTQFPLSPLKKFSFEVDKSDPFKNPPEPDCKLRFEGVDEITKIYRKEVALQYLFGHTHPNMRSYFKKGNFINCEGFVSKYGGYYLINLQISIASTNAKKAFGSLDRGSVLVLYLLNDEKVYGINVAPDDGKIEAYTGNTIYRTRYTIQKSELKELKKHELVKLGIIWSTGYEEYDIYNVDFFMDQIKCLNSK